MPRKVVNFPAFGIPDSNANKRTSPVIDTMIKQTINSKSM